MFLSGTKTLLKTTSRFRQVIALFQSECIKNIYLVFSNTELFSAVQFDTELKEVLFSSLIRLVCCATSLNFSMHDSSGSKTPLN